MTIKNGQDRRMSVSKKEPLAEKKVLRKTNQVITSFRDYQRLPKEIIGSSSPVKTKEI